MNSQTLGVILLLLLLTGCKSTYYHSEGVVLASGKNINALLEHKPEDNIVKFISCSQDILSAHLNSNINQPIQRQAHDRNIVTHTINKDGYLEEITPPIVGGNKNSCISVWVDNNPATITEFIENAVPVLYFTCKSDYTGKYGNFADVGKYLFSPIKATNKPPTCKQTN